MRAGKSLFETEGFRRKTTVVVHILAYLLRVTSHDRKILLAASTHNGRNVSFSLTFLDSQTVLAVDNVLERFLDLQIIDESLIVVRPFIIRSWCCVP